MPSRLHNLINDTVDQAPDKEHEVCEMVFNTIDALARNVGPDRAASTVKIIVEKFFHEIVEDGGQD
jgi:hypothetical protein